MNSRLVPAKKNSSQLASAKKKISQSAPAKKNSSQTVSAKKDASISTTAKTDSRLHNATQTTSFLARPEYFNYQRRQHKNEHDKNTNDYNAVAELNEVGAQYHSNAFLANYLKQNVPEPSADGPPSFYSRYDRINAIGFTKRKKTYSKDVIYDEDLGTFIRVTPEYNGYDLARNVVNDDNSSAQISLTDGSTMKTTDRKTGELFKGNNSSMSSSSSSNCNVNLDSVGFPKLPERGDVTYNKYSAGTEAVDNSVLNREDDKQKTKQTKRVINVAISSLLKLKNQLDATTLNSDDSEDEEFATASSSSS